MVGQDFLKKNLEQEGGKGADVGARFAWMGGEREGCASGLRREEDIREREGILSGIRGVDRR